MLREQLKQIKKELGIEKDDKDTVIQKFRDAIKDKIIPDHVSEVIDSGSNRTLSYRTRLSLDIRAAMYFPQKN